MPVYQTTKHKTVINSIDGVAGTSINCGAPELATGSRDGNTFWINKILRDASKTTICYC